MFRIPRVNVIESDEGFAVEVLKWTQLLYSEGNKSLRIDSEVLARPSGIMIIKKSIRAWEPPHADEPIDENKREAIIDNIRRAFLWKGELIEVM
jgi:hypothetical protein